MIRKMRVCRDLRALSLSYRDLSCNAPWSLEAPRPNHAVSEGLMTLAEDTGSEAHLLFGSSQYALECHHQQQLEFPS